MVAIAQSTRAATSRLKARSGCGERGKHAVPIHLPDRRATFASLRFFRRSEAFMRPFHLFVTACLVASSVAAHANVFATVHGVVHDPQHRPVAGAQVGLNAVNSHYSLHTDTDTT